MRGECDQCGEYAFECDCQECLDKWENINEVKKFTTSSILEDNDNGFCS